GQAGRQQLLLLLVEGLVALGEDAVELAGGQVQAPLAQLLQQQRLGDVVVVVLVQDEGDQVRAVMTAGEHVGGQGGQQGAAVGGLHALPQVTGDVGVEHQFLNDVFLVALGDRPQIGRASCRERVE